MISIGYICQFHYLALPMFPLFYFHLRGLISILQFSYIKLFWQKPDKWFRFSRSHKVSVAYSFFPYPFPLSPQSSV